MDISKKEEEQQLAENKSAKKHYLKKYIFFCLFILISALVFAIYKFAQKPAEGVIKAQLQDDKLVPKANDVPGSFIGEHVSFMYGNEYVLKSHELSKNSSDVILETVYLSESTAISKKINLTVRSLPNGNLEDCPDYKMREIKKERYKKEDFWAGDVSGVSFVPADGSQFEKTFFVKHNGLLAIICMTAASPLDETLNQEANLIAKSLEWIE